VNAMFIGKPKGKGPTAGPANNPGPSPLRVRQAFNGLLAMVCVLTPYQTQHFIPASGIQK
jgi:hypothetical protein